MAYLHNGRRHLLRYRVVFGLCDSRRCDCRNHRDRNRAEVSFSIASTSLIQIPD